MINYFKLWFARRKARRYFNEYPIEINSFDLPIEGKVEFAIWKNPLLRPMEIHQENVSFYKKFIQKGSLVIDIGANIGDTTVPMAIAAGKEGLTLAFDPNPHVFKVLEKNSCLNKDKTNIVPLPFAITESDEYFYYTSSEASFSNGGISRELSDYHGSFTLKEKVKGINLENYLRTNYTEWLPKLSFIKVDAEGYDKIILKTISNLIEEYKPAIVAECFMKLSNKEKIELYEIIENKGYDLYYFYDFYTRAEVIKLDKKEDMIKRKDTFNFYAIPKN